MWRRSLIIAYFLMLFSQELGFSLSNADSLLAIHTGFNTDGDSLWYGSKSYSYMFINVEFENRAVDITISQEFEESSLIVFKNCPECKCYAIELKILLSNFISIYHSWKKDHQQPLAFDIPAFNFHLILTFWLLHLEVKLQ